MKTKKILVILVSIFVVLALVYVYHINSVTREGGQGFSRNSSPPGPGFEQSFDPGTFGYVAPPGEVNRAELSESRPPWRPTREDSWEGGVGSGQKQEGQRATGFTERPSRLRAAPEPGTVKFAQDNISQDNIYETTPPSFMGESGPGVYVGGSAPDGGYAPGVYVGGSAPDGGYAQPRVVRPGQQYDSVLTQPDVQTAEAASNMGTGVRTARSAVYGGTDAPGPGVYVGGSAPREGTYSQAELFE